MTIQNIERAGRTFCPAKLRATSLTTAELATLRRRIEGPKMPAPIARLAELPRGAQVVRSSNPAWARTLDEVYWSKPHNTWLASLDNGTRHAVTCHARELRTAGDQLDLLAPLDKGWLAA